MVRIKKNNFVYNKNIYQCIVPGCQNVENDTNDPSIYFFLISEDGVHQKLLNKFLENVPIRPKVSRICSAHFADNCFELHNGVKLLKANAVPTIRPKSSPSLLKLDESIQNIGNEKVMGEKNNTTNYDKVLMGPPQTTIVKKSQLKNIKKDPTVLSQKLKDKEVNEQHQKEHYEYKGKFQQQPQSKQLQNKRIYKKSKKLQKLNGKVQVGGQEEQLRQLSYRQELQQLRQQNKNFQYQPHQDQNNKIIEKPPVLVQHQQPQQGNGESYDSKETKSTIVCHRQQQHKNKSNTETQKESKQSLQQKEHKEELKCREQQNHIKEHKQQLKRLQQLKRVEKHNKNLSEQKQRILPKDNQQEQLKKELKRRLEQKQQNSGHLQELLLAPPHQEQHYHQMLLQREYLNNQGNQHQQLQRGDLYNRKQKQHNQKEPHPLQFQKQQNYNQQINQQQKHLQSQKLHSSNNLNLESSQLSQQYKHKQMEFEQQQKSQSQLQKKQHILPERQLLNAQAKTQGQPKSQTSSPIPHEEEHLIMCGYITFESYNNNFSYSCNFCSKNLENLNGFSAHLIRLHTNEIENEINSKRLNKSDKIIPNETIMEKQKCGIISISSKQYNLLLNCDFKFDCNFCDQKFEAINKFSEHIGKSHLDLLEKDKVNHMEYEDDVEIDPSCILSFEQIDQINEMDNFLNSVATSNNNSKIVMSVPMSNNSEIYMTLDINENNTNNIKNNNNNQNNNNNNNSNNNNCLNKSFSKEIIEEQNIPMELDSLEKPKLRVNIKHSSWATRYFS